LMCSHLPDMPINRVSNYADWDNFYNHWQGGRAVEYLKQELLKRAEYILVDSRTGLTDIGGICTKQLPSVLVLVVGSNRQSVDGALGVIESLKTLDNPPKVLPQPSRIDKVGERDLLQDWLQLYPEIFSVPSEIADPENYFDRVMVPYQARYSYGEELAVLEEEIYARGSVPDAYQQLRTYIQQLDPRDYFEHRVAAAYRKMGARKIEHDVELAGNQVDVYVEMEAADRALHRVAVEVKDWDRPVGIDVINEFASVVEDLRNARLTDEGVIVSTSGFSKRARNAAQTHGIRLLELADLDIESRVAEVTKGAIIRAIERRVADACRAIGAWKVEHDVELAGNQIDVYVEMESTDRALHRIAVEVKDWPRPVGVDVINKFALVIKELQSAKLVDEGVIVSVSGFTKEARNAAQTYRIRLVELADLDAIAVGPIEKEKAQEIKGFSLKALWLLGPLITVLILILTAIGWVVVNRLGKEPGPQPLAVHLTPVPTAPGPLEVVLGFGNIWHGRSDVQNHLGQPVTTQQSISYAHQFFVTGGYLFERLDTHQIYVLYPTNEWEVYEDDWQEGEDVGDLTPPAEAYVPTEGFGRLWRESPAVRPGLDWGISPKMVGIDGAVQQFEQGLMLFNGLESKQIYILYITSDNHYRWLMLPDNWRPPPGILFVSDRDGDDEIWVMTSDGSEQIPLTLNTWMDGSPAWSSDGSRITYTFIKKQGNEEDIMIMKSDTSGKTDLTANPTVRDTDPAWSPDDSRIAFVSYRDGNAEVYVTKLDGSDPINLTDNPADDWDPTWSPDGSMIAFTSDRDGNPEIYVINSSDGKNLRRLTENATIDEHPAWWQDATSDRIAFVSYRDGNAEIYLMDSDSSHPVNLTNNLTEDKHPTWSSDGSQIAFTSNRDGDREIFVMGADGSHPTNLTDNSVDDWAPHWGR
ncbi:MAG: hypothetical protein E3J21_18705, partial [Anaerolineales bacterium]